MATYLASVQIGRYERGRARRRPMRLALSRQARAKARHDFGRQHQMMEVFSDLFGPYPFGDYTVVVTDDELEIPVEAQGMSIFGANHVDGRRGARAARRARAGPPVVRQQPDRSPAGATSGCTRASPATRSGCGRRPPAGESARRTLAGAATSGWRRSPRTSCSATRAPARLFDDRVYKRGALTLHALRRAVGDQAFFALLREWTSANRHGNVTTDMFLDLALQYATRSYDGFFASWLYGTRLPPLPLTGTRPARPLSAGEAALEGSPKAGPTTLTCPLSHTDGFNGIRQLRSPTM